MHSTTAMWRFLSVFTSFSTQTLIAKTMSIFLQRVLSPLSPHVLKGRATQFDNRTKVCRAPMIKASRSNELLGLPLARSPVTKPF